MAQFETSVILFVHEVKINIAENNYKSYQQNNR